MSRKSMIMMLAVFVALAFVLGGCKRAATPDVPEIDPESEPAAMISVAESNPTPIVVQPSEEYPPVIEPVDEAAEVAPPEPIEVVETPTEVVVVQPVVVSGDEVVTTPEATAEPVVASTPGKHIVQAGENLFRIALRYGTTVEAVARANGITNAALIYVGQTLTIPGGTPGGTPPAPAPVPGDGQKVHVVQAGENLFRIALKYNYSQYYLARYNGIANPSLIYVGQVIRIP